MLIQQFRIMNALHIFIHVHMAMVYCISKFRSDFMAELVAHSMASSFGGGLHNMGNTCFANSVLQGMFYTSRIQKVLCDERVPHGKENINNAHSIVHVKFVTDIVREVNSYAWCAHLKACTTNVRRDPKFIPLAYTLS